MSQRLAHEAVESRQIGRHSAEWWKTPIGYLPNGKAIYPVGGASPDDPSNDDKGSGGSGDGGGEGGSEGQGDKGDDGKGGTGDGAGGNKSETVDKAEYDKVLERMKAADRNSAAALAKLKELEEKDLSEQEKVLKRVPELEQSLKDLQEENKGLKARVAFLGLDGFSWHDPDVALAQVDLSEVTNEDGTINKKELKKAAEALAKEKAFLVKAASDDKGDDKGKGGSGNGQGSSGSGVGSGGRGAGNNGTDEAALKAKYPALNV